MKAYVLTTGVIFALITIAHVLRIILEGAHLASEPFFLLLTLAAAGISVWSVIILRHLPRS